MNEIVPTNRPMQPREVTAGILAFNRVTAPVAILGVRGYYRDTMGKVGENDLGIYDDALFVTSPSCHMAFNANVDPSRVHQGVAMLQPGLWWFMLSIHGKSRPPELQYPCLEQIQPVTVKRADGGSGTLDSGMFAIQIHRGSYGSTSSEGCQTIYPDQYDAFIATIQDQTKRYNQKLIPYLLRENPATS